MYVSNCACKCLHVFSSEDLSPGLDESRVTFYLTRFDASSRMLRLLRALSLPCRSLTLIYHCFSLQQFVAGEENKVLRARGGGCCFVLEEGRKGNNHNNNNSKQQQTKKRKATRQKKQALLAAENSLCYWRIVVWSKIQVAEGNSKTVQTTHSKHKQSKHSKQAGKQQNHRKMSVLDIVSSLKQLATDPSNRETIVKVR